MSAQEADWSKAPEGATHYHPANNYFYRYENGVLQSFVFDAWGESGLFKEYHVGLIPRTAQAWNGEGLPPVGAVCEVDWCEEWHQCEIIAHFQQSCGMVAAFTVDIGHGNKSLDAFDADYFRPIRTPEQIAKDEREAAVEAMLLLDLYLPNTQLGMMSRADFCRTLYDAGYRRQSERAK